VENAEQKNVELEAGQKSRTVTGHWKQKKVGVVHY